MGLFFIKVYENLRNISLNPGQNSKTFHIHIIGLVQVGQIWGKELNWLKNTFFFGQIRENVASCRQCAPLSQNIETHFAKVLHYIHASFRASIVCGLFA